MPPINAFSHPRLAMTLRTNNTTDGMHNKNSLGRQRWYGLNYLRWAQPDLRTCNTKIRIRWYLHLRFSFLSPWE